MALTVEQIRSTKTDEELLGLLLNELKRTFPPEIRGDPVVFLSRVQNSPAGMRAMAETYDLDVSMAMNDLAWHFINHHNSFELAEETIAGLNELGTTEAAEIFEAAFAIIKPHWQELENVSHSKTGHDWLDSNGIEKLMNPLNKRMWNLLKTFGETGLLSLWVTYARKYPDRCVSCAE